MTGQGSFFKSIYFTIVIFVCIGALIPCIAVGGVSAGEVKSLTMSYSHKHVEQMTNAMMSIAETGKGLAIEVYQDKEIIPLLYGQSPENNEIIRGLNRLNTYLRSNTYIESIYVYNRATDYVYSTLVDGRSKMEEFSDTDVRDFLQGRLEWGKLVPVPRTLQGDTDVYTFVYHDGINIRTGRYDNVVLLNINQGMLNNLFLESGKESFEEAFVISPEGKLVSARGDMPLHTDLSDLDYIRDILGTPERAGNFIASIDKEEYLLEFRKMEELNGWIFIDLIYYSALRKPILNIILWSIALVIVTGTLINFIAYRISRKVYRPIASMEKNYREMKASYQKSGFVLKNAVFQNLLSGREKTERKQLEEIIEKYGLNLIIESSTRLFSITLREGSIWNGRFDKGDKELVWFAVSNICDEIGNTCNPTVSVVMQERRLIVMMNMEQDYTDEELKEKFIKPVKENLRRFGGFEIQTVIGDTAEDMCMLPLVYQNIEAYEQYFMLMGKDIITCQDIRERQEKSIGYPKAKEDAYLACFAAGRQEEADRLCGELVREASLSTYNHFSNVLNHMIYSIWNILYQEEKAVSGAVNMNQRSLLQTVQQAGDISEIIEEFRKLDSAMAGLVKEQETEKKQKSNDNITASVQEIIEKEYSNVDLNIQMIAEKLNMSPAYLGRMYSKLAGRTITEEITDKRLKAACALLKMEESIQETAEKCGFCNITYFYRLFKKYYGVTPNVYRAGKQA